MDHIYTYVYGKTYVHTFTKPHVDNQHGKSEPVRQIFETTSRKLRQKPHICWRVSGQTLGLQSRSRTMCVCPRKSSWSVVYPNGIDVVVAGGQGVRSFAITHQKRTVSTAATTHKCFTTSRQRVKRSHAHHPAGCLRDVELTNPVRGPEPFCIVAYR